MNYFDLSLEDYKKAVETILIEEAYEQRNIAPGENNLSPPEKKKYAPIVWKKNKFGNII